MRATCQPPSVVNMYFSAPAQRRVKLHTFGIPLVIFFLVVVTTGVGFTEETARGEEQSRVSFARDVQPILRRHCFRCHGTKNQEAGLQLNRRESVLHSGGAVVEPGAADASLLMMRLVDEHAGDLMPLDGQPLSTKEIAVIRQWIDAGAVWPEELAEPRHWAYQPLARPRPLASPETAEAAHPIDAFVSQRLALDDLTPLPEADRARLLRRVSLALIGLPPTPQEVERFVADRSSDAYEQAVDRLLQSQRFGERWAIPWLDLARYADSNGFQADQIRDNWAYRDWVIQALNEDMPFDQFVIEQIAGDLLPNATVEQRIATGFHRMTTCNVEAGVDPEANRVNQVVDRVNTTATVFLGTTLECAQCHDHKYDPFTQEDYYRVFAYFNNTPLEVKNTSGVTWDFYGPTMELPLRGPAAETREDLQQKLHELEQQRMSLDDSSGTEFRRWLAAVRAAVEAGDGWHPSRPESFHTSGEESYQILDDGAILLSGEVPDKVEHTFTFTVGDAPIGAVRIDALTDDSIPGGGPGRGDPERTNVILNELIVEGLSDGSPREIELVGPVADFSQKNWDVSNAIDGDLKTGWAFAPQFGEPHWARFRFAEPIEPQDEIEQLRVRLVQHFGRGRVYGKPKVTLHHGDRRLVGLDQQVLDLAAQEAPSDEEREQLRAAFDRHDPRRQQLDRKITRVQEELERLQPDTTLVMVEMEAPRETFVMKRGNYESPGERVRAGTPEVLPRDESIEPTGDRLELARWLTSPANPLLARVTVNRWWSELFGTGIVSTPEDFGTQAEEPVHPELLDWLARELIDSGWSMKHVLKQIVMSSTFRQSARATPELLAVDPDNRLLSRGPRFRLPGELVRDNALAISGLLSDQMSGPPVMPYQPDNVWRSVGRNQPTWKTAPDGDRFRRGIYVVFKRAAPYPSFVNFDAPDRGSCTAQRPRTNTPLQALTLLNDPAYTEMALGLADRILMESPRDSDRARMRHAFRLAVARSPSDAEIGLLLDLLKRERGRISDEPRLVQQRTSVPMGGWQPRTEAKAELAAWFAVANALLNLDETMSL